MRRNALQTLLMLFSTGLWAQINFTSLPYDLQFFGRNADDFGHAVVAGSSTDSSLGVLHLVLVYHGTDSIAQTVTKKIFPGVAFECNMPIPARLQEYDLEVYALDRFGNQNLMKKILRLIAGDVILVMGQSNAEASPTDSGSKQFQEKFASAYARSLGYNYSVGRNIRIQLDGDARCGLSSPDSWHKTGERFAGMWPFKFQRDLANITGIPVCIVNAGVGATHIYHHLPGVNIDTTLHNGIYDCTLAKIRHAGLESAVKAVVWYQGESDGNFTADSAALYPGRFRALRLALKQDYPSLKKILMMQLNTGCGGEYLDIIRQHQVDLADEFDDVEIMSTTGTTNLHKSTDGCHYSTAGYERLAENMSGLAAFHTYDVHLNADSIAAPKIVSLSYASPDILELTFNVPVFVEPYCICPGGAKDTTWLRHYFYGENGTRLNISEIVTGGRQVRLKFSQPGYRPSKLTYLPDIFSNLPAVYTGPWILNNVNRSIGALSFYEHPVDFFSTQSHSARFIPNPAQTQVNIISEFPATIRIYTMQGREFAKIHADTRITGVDVSDFPAGVYVVEITSASSAEMLKLLVMR